MKAMMHLLVVIINLLLGKLGLNSENSSIPHPQKTLIEAEGRSVKQKGRRRSLGVKMGMSDQILKKI